MEKSSFSYVFEVKIKSQLSIKNYALGRGDIWVWSTESLKWLHLLTLDGVPSNTVFFEQFSFRKFNNINYLSVSQTRI